MPSSYFLTYELNCELKMCTYQKQVKGREEKYLKVCKYM